MTDASRTKSDGNGSGPCRPQRHPGPVQDRHPHAHSQSHPHSHRATPARVLTDADGSESSSTPVLRASGPVVSRYEAPGALVVTLAGELDLVAAPGLKAQLLSVLRDRPPILVISLDGVSFLDAAGLGVLVAIHRRAALLAVEVRLAAPAGNPNRVLHLTGLDHVFSLYDSVAEALGVPDRSGH